MNIYATSDWHLNPGQEAPLEFKEDGRLVVSELLNILPLGMGEWRTPEGRYTIKSIVEALGGSFAMVVSNHDGRESWIRELFRPYPQVWIARELDIEVGGETYHFEHGHRLSDWRIWSWAADDVVQFLTGWNPTLRMWWYNFCKDRGWMPSYYPVNSVPVGVQLYWASVYRAAAKSGKNYIVGHSHHQCYIDAGVKVWDTGARQLVRIV